MTAISLMLVTLWAWGAADELGVVRPVVVVRADLPSWMAAQVSQTTGEVEISTVSMRILTPSQLRCVVRHEVRHIQRGESRGFASIGDYAVAEVEIDRENRAKWGERPRCEVN
jgi:hypothetical protein